MKKTLSKRSRLELMFGTENEGFCAVMKPFFVCIAVAAKVKNGKIRVQNAKFAGKRLTRDEFIKLR